MTLKLRPELNNLKYYIHLIGISFIVLFILKIWVDGDMLTLKNVLIGAVLIGIADIINHTVLNLD